LDWGRLGSSLELLIERETEEVHRRMTPRVWVAAVWATLIGALTFAAGPLAMLSDHKLVAAVQIVLTSILLPGLILAAEVGSLGPAASVNAVIHFGICFFVLRFLPPFRRTTL
jgi:hypothetical protein